MQPQPVHRQLGRRLTALHREGGTAARLSMTLPLLSGVLLVAQTWVLALILHRAIVEKAGLAELAIPVAAIMALLVLRAGLGLLGELLAVTASEAIKLELRQRLFGAMLAKLPTWTSARSSGGLSTLVLEQVEALDGFFVRYMPAMIQAAGLPIAFAAIILPVDWVVGLILLVTAPLIPVFMMLAGWGAESASRQQARALALLTGRFADRLRGIVTLKLFGRETAETTAMFDAGDELRQRTMRVMRIAFLSSAVLEFFAALGVAGVALYCGLTLLGLVHLRGDPLSLEAALFCLLMAPEVYQPLRLLAAHYHDRAAAKAALGEIETAMGELPAAQQRPLVAAAPARSHPLTVRLANLDVSTPDGAPVLSGASLDLAAGSHTAVLGPSGSGKSTLIETLARLRPYGGSVLIDDASVDSVPEAELRSQVALIGQRPHLFAGTIADNIRFARPGACDTAVAAAARHALVTDFAALLPRVLDTPIGENGLGLSGGEIQRVALARLYLRDPGLILLDEPTGHLDSVTEARVLDNLIAFSRLRTLVIVTHSAAAAARMRRVYRIAGGRLVPAIRPRLFNDALEGAA